MFQLTTKTPATITSITSRVESHGDDKVPGISIGLEMIVANSTLELFEPGLTSVFYREPDVPPAQGEIAEAKVIHMTTLRTGALASVEPRASYEGWKLQVAYGIDETTAIHVPSGRLDKFRLELHEGGSVKLTCRFGSSKLDGATAGRLWELNGHKQDILLLAPEKAEDAPAPEGTNPNAAPKAAGRKPKAQSAQQQLDDARPSWPFPTNGAGAGEAPPQALTVEAVKADATEAFLAAHMHDR